MNGMKGKKERREQAKRFTEDGLPRNPNDWTEDDWRALHVAMEAAKREIRGSHANNLKEDRVP